MGERTLTCFPPFIYYNLEFVEGQQKDKNSDSNCDNILSVPGLVGRFAECLKALCTGQTLYCRELYLCWQAGWWEGVRVDRLSQLPERNVACDARHLTHWDYLALTIAKMFQNLFSQPVSVTWLTK